jgi:mannitol/fructose-specific phosphotransferase system IIA component (Ntr-type)
MSVDLISRPVLSTSLAEYTRSTLIVSELREQNAPGIINELSQQLHTEGYVPDLLPFYQAALNQELLNDSESDCGVAFPHARLSGIRKLAFAYGRTGCPVSWGHKGSSPVEFIFLLAVPATDAAQYLHLLASLARLAKHPEILARLRGASSAEEVLRIFAEVNLRQTSQ